MDNLATREIFRRIMNFEYSHRTLKWEFAYWSETIFKWYDEGLPKLKEIINKGEFGCSFQFSGPALRWGSPSYSNELPLKDLDVSDYFDFDEQLMLAPYDYWIYPKFEKKVIYENDKYIEYVDEIGIRQQVLKKHPSMPLWLEFPIKNSGDWEKIREERFNIDSINKRWSKDIIEKYWGKNLNDFIFKTKNRSFPLHCLHGPVGFFGSLRYLFGQERLFLMYYDNPKLIKDIAKYLCDLWIMMVEEVTSKVDFDLAGFWEDMAGKNGSLISPSMFKEFMSPYYKRLIDFLKTKNINLFCVDCDGNLEKLLPLFEEVGINIIYPIERQANNNLFKIRSEFPKLRLWGGIDKNALAKGKYFIDKELEKIDYLIRMGGYIPFCDHSIPPNITWEDWKYYRNKLNEIITSTEVCIKH